MTRAEQRAARDERLRLAAVARDERQRAKIAWERAYALRALKMWGLYFRGHAQAELQRHFGIDRHDELRTLIFFGWRQVANRVDRFNDLVWIPAGQEQARVCAAWRLTGYCPPGFLGRPGMPYLPPDGSPT